MNRFLVFMGILVVFSLCTGVVSAADWTVNPGGSIQVAVNGAGDNDTVIVNDDNGTAYTYTENVVINKKLTVTAASGANVTVQAFDTSFPVFDIENNCNGSTIQNFTIMGATDSMGIYLENSDSITISGNTIINNFWGIYLKNSYKNTISQNHLSDNSYGVYFESSGNNTISGNELATNYNGMWLQNSSSNTLTGNTLANHYTYGLVLDHSDFNAISRNNIINNYSCRGIWLQNSANNTLNNNQLTSNYVGMWLDYSPSNTISGNNGTNNDYGLYIYQSGDNTILENSFADNYVCGLVLDYSDNNTVSGNNLTSNDYGGIWLDNAGSNTLTENECTGSHFGMCLNYSPNNTISGNNGSSNDYGFYLDYSDNNQIVDNNLTLNWVALEAHYSNNGTITRNSFIDNNGNGIIFYYSSGNINFNRIFGNGLEYEGYGLYNDGAETVDATDNWWGSDDPVVSLTGPSDIGVAWGTVLYDPWFGADIAFTVDAVKTASEVVKTYIETNHQLPCGVDISGIEVNMAQFLKLSTQAVLNINDELNNTIILGGFQDADSPLENITRGLVFDAEFVDLAADIKNSMNSNGYAPDYVAHTSLGDFMGFESLVYMYSQILTSYNCTEGVLPDSVGVVPWIGVSNPDMVYNFRTQEFFNTIQAAIDDVDTQDNDTITLGDGTFTENVDVDKRLKITSLYGNTKINAADMDLPVFTILFEGSGSIIQNLIIMGATGNAGIYVNNSNNNTLFQNNLTSNLNGVCVENSTYNTISGNIITNNTVNGIYICSCLNSTISDNTVKSNIQNGIKMIGSTNIDTSRNIVSNNGADGIYSENSTAEVKFNVITGNTGYGVYNTGNGTVNAQNNWWGSNFQGTDPLTVGVVNTGVNATTWLVLNGTSSCDRSNRTGPYYNYITTANVSKNNQGEDTDSDSCIPNDILIYFNTTLGAINSSASTRNGKAVAIINSTTSGTADVTVTLDNQTITTTINVMSVNELGIYNTRTNEEFETIQAAIDDVDTLNDDIITLKDGTYTENVVVNKKLTIKPVTEENVFVQTVDPDSCVFTITGAGSGSLIQGFTINGGLYGIFLNSTSGCNITENTLLDNVGGIYLYNATNSNITGNTLISNGFGINLDDSNDNILSGNSVKGNLDGINLYGSNNNIITGNHVKNNYNGIYLYNSNNTTINENVITNNGVGIAYIDSNSTTLSGNNVTDNWIENTSQVDTTGIIMAINEYYCGPATLATVLKNLGVNATQEELATLAGTDETGTTMYGLAQAAQSKGLIAKGLKLSVSQLKTNNIVFLTINGEGHYCIVTNITDTMVYLADTDLGNINMTVTNFTTAYSGNALVVTNDTNDPQLNTGTELTNQEMQDIKGNGAWIKVWRYESYAHWGYYEHYGRHSHYFTPGTLKTSASAWAVYVHWGWHEHRGWHAHYGWHRVWVFAYTLPMNYVGYFTP